MKSSTATLTVVQVPIERIRPSPFQPRETSYGDIGTLAGSIKQAGLINPITIRKVGDSFQLVTGERRLRALKKLGVRSIPCVMKADSLGEFGSIGLLSDESTMPDELALITAYRENLERNDYDPLEEAKFFDNAIRHPEKFVGAKNRKKWTTKELGERLGVPITDIEGRLVLLSYPKDVQDKIVRLRGGALPESGELPVSWARDIMHSLDESEALKLARQIVKSPNMVCQEHSQTWGIDHIRFHVKTIRTPEHPISSKEAIQRIRESGRDTLKDVDEDIRRPMEATIRATVNAQRDIQSTIKPRIEREFRERPELARPLVIAAQATLSKVPILECPHCHTRPTRVVWECCKQPFKA